MDCCGIVVICGVSWYDGSSISSGFVLSLGFVGLGIICCVLLIRL